MKERREMLKENMKVKLEDDNVPYQYYVYLSKIREQTFYFLRKVIKDLLK